MKNKIVLGLIAITLLLSTPLNVYAVGSASINFRSEDTVTVGNNIKVYMSIEDVEDANNGIVGVGGKLIFDNEKLEFVEANLVDAPYDFWFNPKSNKLAGLDFTFENAINKDTKIYEFTFKAIATGTTTITLEEAELSDSKTSILNSIVYGKEIVILEKVKEEDNNIEKEVAVKKEEIKPKEEIKQQQEITNKEKLEKMNDVVHGLLKKLSNLL